MQRPALRAAADAGRCRLPRLGKTMGDLSSPSRWALSSWWRDSRLAATFELLLVFLCLWLVARGTFWVRTPTIPLLILGSMSLPLRQSGWRKLGMRQPSNWPRTMTLSVAVGAAYQLVSLFMLEPALRRLTGEALQLDNLTTVRGNPTLLVVWIAVTWSLAAFGEEMAYRGYLLNRCADVAGRSTLGWAVSALTSSALFALAHGYQGRTGVLATLISGIVMTSLYLMTKRNLWLPIMSHGIIDTIGFTLVFLGLYP